LYPILLSIVVNKDVRMSHAFNLKNLVAMSPYVIRDREFLIHVKTSGTSSP